MISGFPLELVLVLAAVAIGLLALPWRSRAVSSSWSAGHRAASRVGRMMSKRESPPSLTLLTD